MREKARYRGRHRGPVAVKIPLPGRAAPTGVLLLAVVGVPFLGGSAPQDPTASVVLAAGTPHVVDVPPAAAGAAREGVAGSARGRSDTVGAGQPRSAFGHARGEGPFMFPAIELAPLVAQAIAAPIVGTAFIHPVPGSETSPFGPRIHPVLGRPMFHTGIDLAATCGTPIRAAATGRVIYAEVSDSWGRRTIIEHTPTLKTAYGHQSRFLVKEGDVVKRGQVIGLAGSTGWSTACHLHFDVIVNDRYVDPAPYLGFPASGAPSVPFALVPHVGLDGGGHVVHTVEDGDMPPADAVRPLKPARPGGRQLSQHKHRPATPTVPATPGDHATSAPPATPTAPTGVPTTRPSSPTARPTTPMGQPTTVPPTRRPATPTVGLRSGTTTTTVPASSERTEPAEPSPSPTGAPTPTETTPTQAATATASDVLAVAAEIVATTTTPTSDATTDAEPANSEPEPQSTSAAEEYMVPGVTAGEPSGQSRSA